MRRRLITAAACVTVLISSAAAGAERFALIIGNGAYESVEPLANPPNDVELVADSLREVGFTVTLLVDATRREMDEATKQLALLLDDAGRNAVGVFYYAGHAVSYEGRNWLLPVDANITQGADIEYESISSAKVLGLMEDARNATDIMVLDSCRNSPFRGFSLSGTRSLSRGLVTMAAPSGSFIAYSTVPGQVAYDGTGRYSPFASAFAAEIRTPDLSIGDMMINVTRRVKDATQGLGTTRQVPWTHSSLDARFAFNPGAAQATGTVATSPPSGNTPATEVLIWQSIQDSTDPAEFEAYLAAYPDGNFAAIAKARVRRLTEAPAEIQKNVGNESASGVAAITDAYSVDDRAFRGIANSAADVFEEPDRLSYRQRRINVGDRIRVTGRVRNRAWYRVQLDDGAIGYISMGAVDRL